MAFCKRELDIAIRRLFADTFAMQNEDNRVLSLNEDTVLMETGLDSLGFAILVTRIEEELGYDPFSLSAEAYYPVTYGDFLTFYLDNQPR